MLPNDPVRRATHHPKRARQSICREALRDLRKPLFGKSRPPQNWIWPSLQLALSWLARQRLENSAEKSNLQIDIPTGSPASTQGNGCAGICARACHRRRRGVGSVSSERRSSPPPQRKEARQSSRKPGSYEEHGPCTTARCKGKCSL